MKYFILLFCLLLSHPGLCQDDDEAMLNELEAAKSQQSKAFQQIDQGAEAIKTAPLNVIEELKKSGHKALDAKALMDPKMVAMLKRSIKESKIQDMSPEQVKAMIMTKVKGKPMEKIFLKFPKLLDMAAGIVVDREALSSLLDILPRQDDLKFFGWCSLGLFIFGFILKRIIVSKDAGLLKRITISLMIHSLITIATFGLFFYLFQNEVGPSLRVIARHL